MNVLIKSIEHHAQYYGLNLNRNKCGVVKMNADNKIKFGNGQELQRTQSTIYLGTEINAAADPTLEVQRRMAEVCVTWKKLDTFWKHSNTPTKIKIQIYDAVIRSKLVYGLESLQLTKAWQNRINAFQLKGLRKILKLLHRVEHIFVAIPRHTLTF